MMWNSLRADRSVAIPVLLPALLCLVAVSAAARGPVSFEGEEAASIYRDYDDGLFGRSRYRGIIYSVKLSSFDRFRSLPVADDLGLCAYLVSEDRAMKMTDGGKGLILSGIVPGAESLADDDPGKWLFGYDSGGIRAVFSLERAPDDLYEEIALAYSGNPDVAVTVSDSYRGGFILRIREAENVYRPEFATIDYEDVLLTAALFGDDFQPLWGIHDGNSFGTEN